MKSASLVCCAMALALAAGVSEAALVHLSGDRLLDTAADIVYLRPSLTVGLSPDDVAESFGERWELVGDLGERLGVEWHLIQNMANAYFPEAQNWGPYDPELAAFHAFFFGDGVVGSIDICGLNTSTTSVFNGYHYCSPIEWWYSQSIDGQWSQYRQGSESRTELGAAMDGYDFWGTARPAYAQVVPIPGAGVLLIGSLAFLMTVRRVPKI